MMKKSVVTFAASFLVSSLASADVVLTMGGDVNFNRNRLSVQPQGVQFGDKHTPFSYFTSNIRPLLNGDLNFANIETVVSASNDLKNEDKQYAFVSHRYAIDHLLDIGFNMFSLANNHTYDYGQAGMNRTFAEFEDMKRLNPDIIFHGINYRPQLLQPEVFVKNGIKIAFATISIADPKFRGADNRKGILHINNDADYRDLIIAFANTKADFKILSTHYGSETKANLDGGQKNRFEYALQYGGIDLIIGHHPHVPRAISKNDKGLIFYSLGNYMMLGSADMTSIKNTNLDWGMFSRLYLDKDKQTGKVSVNAVEVIPLTKTHTRTELLGPDQAARRILGLNALSEQDLSKDALKLRIDKRTGKGFYCAPKITSKRAAAICK